jgi:hypothetical protein
MPNHAHSWPVQALAAVCAMACQLASAQTVAQPLLSAQASVSNFAIRLVSLAPESGQTPWISYRDLETPDGPIGMYGALIASELNHPGLDVPGLNSQDYVYQGVLPAEAKTVTSLDGVSSAGGNATGAFARSSIRAQDLTLDGRAPDSRSADTYSTVRVGSLLDYFYLLDSYDPTNGRALTKNSTSNPFEGFINFTLAPYTQVVFEGLAQVGVDVSNQVDASWYVDEGIGGFRLNTSASAASVLSVARATPAEPLQDGYPDLTGLFEAAEQGYQVQTDRLDLDWSVAGAGKTETFNRTLRVALRNDSAEALDGVLMLNIYSSTYVFKPGAMPTAIPEPSTYALMGLGLVGLALVKRRQTRAA